MSATNNVNPQTVIHMSEPFLGEIRMVGFNYAPSGGWALCNGQLMAISQNSALFSLLGTAFGGDGRVTFGLPNLQGRVPVNQGQLPGASQYAMGQTGGTEGVTLTPAQMPAHTHAAQIAPGAVGVNVAAAATAATAIDPVGNIPAQSQQSGRTPVLVDSYAAASAATGSLGGVSVTGSGQVTVGAAGNSQPFGILQPYQVVNFIIATQGIYPSRP
jgi:microcystin-dependent protein